MISGKQVVCQLGLGWDSEAENRSRPCFVLIVMLFHSDTLRGVWPKENSKLFVSSWRNKDLFVVAGSTGASVMDRILLPSNI